MEITLFLSIFFGLSFIYMVIGLLSARSVHNTQEYFLADRKLGVFALTFTLIATQLGSGMILGTAERSYHAGVWGILYTLGISTGFLILSLGFASKLRGLHISTTAQIFEVKYRSLTLKAIASLLSIISLCGILISQIVASKQLLLGLKIYSDLLFGIIWAMVISYTMAGGLQSVIITDIAQLIFIMTIFTLSFLQIISKIPSSYLTFQSVQKIQLYFPEQLNLPIMLASFLMPVLFSLIEQDVAQRFFAAKNKATATISAFFAGLCITAFACIPMFIGMFAKFKAGRVIVGANPLIVYLEKISSPFMFILIVCGIIAAISATSNSLLCAISSNIAQDFSIIAKHKYALRISKIVTLFMGVICFGFAFFINTNIIGILENSYRVSVSCLFIPTVIAYFFDHLSKKAAYFSILCGAIGFILYLYMPVSIAREFVPLALSGLGYILGMSVDYFLYSK